MGKLFKIMSSDCEELKDYIQRECIIRLNQLERIKDTGLFIQDITGEDKTIDISILYHVNSGGTELRGGNIALAYY